MTANIGDLDINPRIAAAAKRAGLNSAESVLNQSGPEIERLTGLTASDVTQLKDAVSEVVLHGKPHVTALEMWRQECSGQPCIRKLSSGCPVLDKYLRGGILARGITEIAGESAAGKTQLCLQLCITAQLPPAQGGLGGGAVYVCTEDVFPSKRLQQLVQHFSQKYKDTQQGNTGLQFSDRIFVEHVADFEGLDVCLQKKIPLLLGRGMIKLIVIDSVAALFRCHYESHNLVSRAKHLASLATRLQRLSDQYSTAIVCVNQVSANMSGMSDSGGHSRQSLPALGLVWADHVTCRFLMSRPENQSALAIVDTEQNEVYRDLTRQLESGVASLRQLEVMFAPHIPSLVLPIVITGAGISCLG